MVQLSCIHAEGSYGPFDLRFRNGFAMKTDAQYAEMVKRDPEMWQRFLDREEIVVLRDGQKVPSSGPKITVHRFDADEAPKRPSGIPVFTPKEVGEIPEGTDTTTVETEDVTKAPPIPGTIDKGTVTTPQAPVGETAAPRAVRASRKKT